MSIASPLNVSPNLFKISRSFTHVFAFLSANHIVTSVRACTWSLCDCSTCKILLENQPQHVGQTVSACWTIRISLSAISVTFLISFNVETVKYVTSLQARHCSLITHLLARVPAFQLIPIGSRSHRELEPHRNGQHIPVWQYLCTRGCEAGSP